MPDRAGDRERILTHCFRSRGVTGRVARRAGGGRAGGEPGAAVGAQASSESFGRDPVDDGAGGMTTPQVMIIFIAASTVI